MVFQRLKVRKLGHRAHLVHLLLLVVATLSPSSLKLQLFE